MEVKRIFSGVRFACLSIAVVIPFALFARSGQSVSTTQPAQGRSTTQPHARPPKFDEMLKILRQRQASAAQSPRSLKGTKPSTTTGVSPGEPLRKFESETAVRSAIKRETRFPASRPAVVTAGPEKSTLPPTVVQTAKPAEPAEPEVPTIGTPSPGQTSSAKLPTTLPANEKAVQFSFNNAPLSAVFDFMERITGLPILGDRNIAGQPLTYFNRKKMTPYEAIDELNLLLADRGIVLIRAEDHLRIDKYPDALRKHVRDFLTAADFLKADVPPNQVVRVFVRVTNLSAEELTSLLAEALPVNEAKLAAWKTPNQIQIIALASQARRIIGLTGQLDSNLNIKQADQSIKIFKPKFVTPSTLERLIKAITPTGGNVVGPGNMQLGNPGFAGNPNVIRSSGASGPQLIADDVTGILVLQGSPSVIQQTTKLVEMLDVQDDVSGNLTAVRVAVKYASVQALEMIINESIKQRIQSMGSAAARSGNTLSVRSDESTRTIVLAGARTLVEQAQKIVQMLDQPTVTDRVQIIPISSARAENILRDILNPFYQNAKRQPPAAADPVSNSIITWATGSELDELKTLLKQIDESAKEGRGVPVIHTYTIDDMDVNRVAANLQQIYQKQQDVTFGADPAGKILLVAAPSEKHERIEKIIEDLRSKQAQRNTPVLVELKYANVDQIAQAIQRTYATRRTPTGEPRVEVTPNLQANSVVVTGVKFDVEEAVKLIRQLDDRIRSSSEIKTFKLTYAQSDDLVKMITELYGPKDPTLKAVSDPWTNTLFISGGSGNLSAIEQMIKSIDHSEPVEVGSNNIAYIALKTAAAGDVADRVDSMLSASGSKNLPSIEASETGNYLVVIGQPKQIERVRQLAEQIDKMSRQIPEIIAIRPIQKASADKLAQMLDVIVPQTTGTEVKVLNVDLSSTRQGLENFMRQSHEPSEVSIRPVTTRPSINPSAPNGDTGAVVMIGVDARSNTLIIRGRPKEIEEIDKAIATLTTDMQEDVQFKIFPLKNANPSDVAVNLEALFNETTAAQPQPQPQPQNQPRPQQVAQNQPQPSQPNSRGNRQARVAGPNQRRIRAIPIDQISSVVVRAEPRDFQTVEQFITQLDYPDPGNIRMFKLNHARADFVCKCITDLFRSRSRGSRRSVMAMAGGGAPGGMMMGGRQDVQFNATYDLTTNTVLVTANKSDMKDVDQVIATIDKPEISGVEVHVLPLRTGKADKLAPLVQDVLQKAEQSVAQQRGITPQTIAVTGDKTTNTLLIAGSNRQFEQVKQIVDQLQATRGVGGGERRIYVVPMQNLEPTQAKQLLDQLIPAGAGGSSTSWPIPINPSPFYDALPKSVIPFREQLRLTVAGLAYGQVAATRAKAPATQPAIRRTVPVKNAVQSARELKIIQQMLDNMTKRQDANRQRDNGSVTDILKRFGPPGPLSTTRPAVTTTPATTQPETRFPQIIIQPKANQTPGINVQGVTTQPGSVLTTSAAQQLQSLASQIKGGVDINAVPEKNALIIEASEEDYQVIQKLLNLLDQAIPQAKVQIYALKNARASDLAPVLGQIYASRPVPRGYPPVTITPDLATNSIIVSAVPDMQKDIEQSIRQLDTQKLPPMEFRVFTLKNAKASQLVPQIEQMLKQITQARGQSQTPITLTADDRTNSVIVTAPQTHIDQISKLISTLDAVPSYATVEMDIVRLKLSDADSVGKLLTSLTTRGGTTGGGQAGSELLTRLQLSLERAGMQGTLDLEKPIRILPDKPSQSLVLLSTVENLKILRSITELLDKVAIAEDVRVRVYPIKIADAQELQRALNDIFTKGRDLTKVPGTGHDVGVPPNPTGQAIVYNVIVAADKQSNTIIAAGQETSLALIDVLIGQMDVEKPGVLYPIRTVGLKYANGEKLSKLLQDMLDARDNRAKSLGGERAANLHKTIVKWDERINILLVSASEDDFKALQTLIKSLDVAPEPGVEPVVIYLKRADAKDLADMLDKFFKARADVKTQAADQSEVQPGFPPKIPVIIPDPFNNALVVSAGKTNLQQIQLMVEKIDGVTPTKKMQIAVIPLRSADASQLAQAITQVLNPTGDQTGLKQSVILEFIRRTPEGRKIAQQALKEKVFVYGDKTSNLLIALAPEETICIIESLAKNIDEVAPSVELKIFALENADAEQMRKTLDDLFGGKGGGSAGGTASAPTITIAGETAGGQASAIEKEVTAFTADTRTNSIIVSATATYMKLIEKVICQLDAKAIQQQKMEVITLQNADADTVQKAVSTLIENQLKMYKEAYGQQGIAPERVLEQQVNIVADNSTRKIILQASPRYFTTVRKIIDDLDEPKTQVLIQCMIVEVTLTGRIEYGFEAVGQDLSFTKAQTAPGIGPGHDVVVGTDVGAAGTGVAGFTASLRSEDWNLLLRALNTDGKSQVISRPQITAWDNTKAKIQIGQNVPIPTGSNTASETGNLNTTIEYKDVGVILEVTPHINSEGYVNMEVKPEISSISTSSVQIAQGLNAPILNKNTIDTRITIKDGETVIIGGLITKRRNHSETKVPFFGDIPILGYAFKSVTDEETKDELLVVLTPKIMGSVEKAHDLSAEERDLMELLPRDVRESQLMGRLRQSFDEEGYAIPQPEPTSQPGTMRLFNLNETKKDCNEQLKNALKRTCDQ